MSSDNFALDKSEFEEWRDKITIANRHNIFCHCRQCNYQWIDSDEDAICKNCDSSNVEHISCWQFPDD